jgi:hypothetical protein
MGKDVRGILYGNAEEGILLQSGGIPQFLSIRLSLSVLPKRDHSLITQIGDDSGLVLMPFLGSPFATSCIRCFTEGQ